MNQYHNNKALTNKPEIQREQAQNG